MLNKVVEILLQAKDTASATFATAEKNLTGTTSKIGTAIKALGALAVTVALGKFFKDAVAEATEAERSMAKLGQAVSNAGGDFSKLQPAMERAIDGVRRLSTYSDDELTASLGKLVLMTGDTQLSMDNLGLAADMAAASGMSLDEASALLGKTLNGQVTKGLKDFGVTATDAAGALTQLHANTKGMAEHLAGTFSGALEKLGNDWKQFQQAVGKAIIGNEDLKGALGGLSGALAGVAKFVENNSEVIGKLVTAAIEMGTAIWEVARVPLKYFAEALAGVTGFVGGLLEGIGTLVEKGGGLLKQFGLDTGTNVGASMKDAGAALVAASQAAYDALEGRTTKGEAAVTKAATDGQGKRLSLSAEAVKQQEGLAKKASDERLKVQEATEADLLRVYAGGSEKLAAETIRRHTLITELMENGLVKQADQLKEAWKKQDEANLLLAAGFDKDLIPAMKRTETKFGELKDAADKIPDSVKAAGKTSGKEGAAKDFGEASDKLGPMAEGIKHVDENAGTAIANIGTLADQVGRISGGDPLAIVAAVGLLGGVLAGIFASGDAQAREHLALLGRNNDVIKALIASNGDLLRINTPGGNLTNAAEAIRAALAVPHGNLLAVTPAPVLGKELLARGLTTADLEAIAKELGIDLGPRGGGGAINTEVLQAILYALDHMDVGFGETFADQMKRIMAELATGILSPAQRFAAIKDVMGTGAGSSAIAAALGTGDFTTEAGKATIVGSLQDLLQQFAAGTLNKAALGGLSGTDFLTAMTDLVGLLTTGEQLVGFVPPRDQGGLDMSASFAGLADVGVQQVDYLSSIDANIGAMIGRWTDIDTGIARGPAVVNVGGVVVGDVVVSGGLAVGVTARDVQLATQAATIQAINEALATVYRGQQLSRGIV